VIRVYAFVHEAARVPEIAGVDGAPIEQHGRGVSAVVSRHERAAAGDPRHEAVAHGLVVEALASVNDAVLPVRFGETFADNQALDAILRDRDDEIRATLARVCGCVELGVRVAGAVPQRAAAAAESGTGYMEARLALLAERDTVVHGLHDELRALARDAVQSERGGFEGAYLVERPRIEAAYEVVQRFTAAHRELTIVCTGPWAPYSFGGTRA